MNRRCGREDHHNAHEWESADGLEWCDGDGLISMDEALLADLATAEQANMHARDCQMCDALEKMSESVQGAMRAALAGTIGRDKLVTILNRHGYTVGRRAIERHRQEGHTS